MSAARNDGGPAFPSPVDMYDGKTESAVRGMALRDYFAAKAPADIPAWFSYGDDLPPIPHILPIHAALEQQPAYAALPEDDKDHLVQWLGDGSWDLDPPLSAIGVAASRAIDASIQARRDAEEQREAERYFAWRWHYADAMLKARAA